MASAASNRSPRSTRKSTPTALTLGQFDPGKTALNNTSSARKHAKLETSQPSMPGSTSKNLQDEQVSPVSAPFDPSYSKKSSPPAQFELSLHKDASDFIGVEDILARLRLNDNRKTPPKNSPIKEDITDDLAVDEILETINNNSKTLQKQAIEIKEESESDMSKDQDRSSGSDLFTPATDSFEVVSCRSSQNSDTVRIDTVEILKVKAELAAAKAKIAKQDQELADTRNLKHTMEQAIGSSSEAEYGSINSISDNATANMQSAFNVSARPFTSRTDSWSQSGGFRPNTSGFNGACRGRRNYNGHTGAGFMDGFSMNTGPMTFLENPIEDPANTRQYNAPYNEQISPVEASFGGVGRTLSVSSNMSLGFDGRVSEPLAPAHFKTSRHGPSAFRTNSTFSDRSLNYPGFPNSLGATSPPDFSPIGLPPTYGYQSRALAPPLSPIGSEYSTSALQGISAWANTANNQLQTFVNSVEPMNYRRLLDKSVSCDWKYIVDKIVCNNDQQASIFLQQKLKVGTAEQKFEIVEAIVNQAYPLMINRFGNFLIQRCFEHGTPEQVVAIANAIHGNVLSLSMDPFGCHVIQKAFDSVPENHKADMVRELLRRIPDTVIHRYACHVWQKLFELRWCGNPPQIMSKVNEALYGMWHEVALGETGSLVVQNIFENCVEEEKRPAIEEVIESIDLIAHGQFGNWCIQHLCEHGSPPDKRRVVDHILANSYSYSIDQFASKVVEKCLKIGGADFLDRYLSEITTSSPDRPRIPLIDIAGDQYGNYLVQWILMNTHHHQREQVAVHIRKHMVSLRGSKFGSRVAMLCCNPASITRPGPGVIVNPYGAPGQPRGWGRFR